MSRMHTLMLACARVLDVMSHRLNDASYRIREHVRLHPTPEEEAERIKDALDWLRSLG